MKKFFTLIAAALFGAVSMNAQTEYRAPEAAIDPGTVLVDNDLAKVSTVFNSNAGLLKDANGKEAPVSYGGKTFSTYFQVRVNAAPSASDPVGTEQSGSTPLVIVAKQNVDLTVYYRRQTQSVNDGEYYTHEQNEGKDLKLVDQTAPATLLEAADYQWTDAEEGYGNVAKTYKLDAGHTYTFWARGTTGRVYGFDLAAGEGSGTVAPEPAGASIPGALDLSKTVVEKGDSEIELHASAGWNGSNIDWMQNGQIAKIEFTNSKAAKYDIVSYAGTPNTGVTVEFKILNAAGAEVYKQVAEYVAGGWGDQTPNTTLPTTDELPAGNYTLVLTFINLEGNTTVNIYKIEFKETAGETPAPAGGSFNVDLSTLDPSESQGNKTLCYLNDGSADTPRLDYPSSGDIGKLEVVIPETSAYKITFNYASPMDKMFMVWTLTNEAGEVVFNEYFPLDPTGAPSDYWTIYKDFDGMPATPVLAAGKYTLRLYYNITVAGEITPAWYNGDENKNFHSNIKSITFTAVAGGGETPAAGGKTIYSWKGAEAGATEVGGKAVASDGESVNYLNKGGDDTEYYTIRINKKKADIATDNVEFTLDEALQAGDQIAITAYRNKDTDANGTLYILFENGAEIDEGTDVVWNNVHADYGQKPNTNTYTVDAAAGSKSFKVARSAASTNVFITEIKITRGGGAAEETGRVWDFTKWSDATVAALKADAAASKVAGWSDVEKAADAEAGADPTDISKDNCFWCVAEPNEDGTLSANGVVIEELKGLKFLSEGTTKRSLAIAVNYPETSLGAYAGPSYLWLGSSNTNYFIIPQVEAGSIITMDVESHKPSDARGIRLLAGGTDGENLGEFTPTTLETLTWSVPTTTDVYVQNTNGCHIYNIKVADATGIEAVQAVKVVPVNNFIYNLAGQRVDANYKGVVIKNGKKYLQK